MQNRKSNRGAAKSRARLNQDGDNWTMRLYGIVGDDWDGFTDDTVADLLDEAEGSGTIRLNSPGGFVYQGMAIYNLLREKGVGLVKIDGAAYSMGSVIAMVGKRIEIGRGAMIMIHNPWNVAIGDSREMRKNAEILDKMRDSILDIYQSRTGQERELLAEMMDEETWLTADEAVEWGFADAVVESEDDADPVDLTLLKDSKNMPDHLAQQMKRQLEHENSLVNRLNRTVPQTAAAAATNPQHSEEPVMKTDKSNQPAAAPETAGDKGDTPENRVDEAKVRDAAVAAERKRCAEIRRLTGEAKLKESFGQKLIDDGVELEEAKAAIERMQAYLADEVPEQQAAHRIEVTRDERDHVRQGGVKALMNRFKPGAYKIEGDDPARQFANMSLMEMARHFVEAGGKNTSGMSRVQIAKASLHSTSDFPLILENVVGKSLRDAYELAPRVFQELGVRETLPDFKEVSRVRLGSGPQLQKVQEGGEYTYGELDEGSEKYRVFKYGKVLALTWEALINDDLNAFTRVPAMLGAAAAQIESDIFWAELTGNPDMADEIALFHADHDNLAAGGSASAIDIDSLSAGRTAMRQQKDGEFYLNLQPRFLVVPTAQETKAEQFVSTNFRADAAGNINPFSGRLQVVSEPRLDANSTDAWYLWADPAVIDTIAYAYLQGEEGPQIDTEEGFDVDGMKVKVRHVFGSKALDHRGLYKNDGS